MNIRDLTYLVALFDHQHFGKAAKACFVSQPALSMQIQKLEETLGIKLLERTNKMVLFTHQGLMVVEYARDILKRVDELYEFSKQAQDPYRGELKIGIFPTLAPYFLPLIFPALSQQFPKLSIYLMEEQTDQLINKLVSGELDAAFLALPIIEKNMFVSKLFNEEFLLAVPKTSELANKKIIRQKDLINKKLFLLEEGHCLREQALALCYKLNASEAQNFRATSLETLRHMVASGLGMTLVPRLACDMNDNIAYISFADPKPDRCIGLVWRASSLKHNLLLEIVAFIKKCLLKSDKIR